MCFARGVPQDVSGFARVLQRVPLRISVGVQVFCKGPPPEDFSVFPFVLQGVPIRISVDFQVFCKGYPLGFQWMSMCFAMGTP